MRELPQDTSFCIARVTLPTTWSVLPHHLVHIDRSGNDVSRSKNLRHKCNHHDFPNPVSSVHRAFKVLGMRQAPLAAAARATVAAAAAAAAPHPPQQQPLLACSAAQLRCLEGELRRSYRQLSVAIHPDKCRHAQASKVPPHSFRMHILAWLEHY